MTKTGIICSHDIVANDGQKSSAGWTFSWASRLFSPPTSGRVNRYHAAPIEPAIASTNWMRSVRTTPVSPPSAL